MHKITTHLWFDTEAAEAARLYTSLFENSKIVHTSTLHNTPSGSVEIVDIELEGQEFTLMAAGPYFKFTPAVSFLIACSSKAEVDQIWAKLSEGGKTLMELGKYPFSEWYGWTEDKYGLSWQIMDMGERPITQKIIPTMMFVGDVVGKAEEAVKFYTGVFDNSEIGFAMRYEAGEEPDQAGTVKHMGFTLEGQQFAAMDSARAHDFTFTEAISFMVHCKDQKEIDYFWEKLSAVPEAEQCGWLKDKYGFSWQIVPTNMNEMMRNGTEEQVARVTEAFLKMKKFNLAELDKAYNGK